MRTYGIPPEFRGGGRAGDRLKNRKKKTTQAHIPVSVGVFAHTLD